MTGDGTTDVEGASPETVRTALRDGAALPECDGFAGVVDGSVVRDVLGRRPLFVGRGDRGWRWARSPRELDDPVEFPPGGVVPLERFSDPSFEPLEDVRRAWTLPSVGERTVEEAVEAVAAALDDRELDGDPPVAFSGGVDSAVVASLSDGPLYVAGFPGSHDVAAARSAAAAVGRSDDLRVVRIDRPALERVVPRVARATDRTNAMDVAIVAPLWLVAERVRADGHDRLAVGQGADELFGGYDKVARAPSDERVEADTVREARTEVVATLPDQLSRDVTALRAAGVEVAAPFLHDGVVRAALSVPPAGLVGDRGVRKLALRLAARRRLPDRIAFREKKAVQYGSRVARELDRAAREAGFEARSGDNVARYVESLLG
jgi:asparagine synthase (glutamine-hydrolysing)